MVVRVKTNFDQMSKKKKTGSCTLNLTTILCSKNFKSHRVKIVYVFISTFTHLQNHLLVSANIGRKIIANNNRYQKLKESRINDK